MKLDKIVISTTEEGQISSDSNNQTSQPVQPFRRKVGGLFFDPKMSSSPIQEPQESTTKHQRVRREQRIKGGGLPANKLASALTEILSEPMPERSGKELLSTHYRGIRLDIELFSAIEELTDKRGVPNWTRSAIEFVAENSVPPERLHAEAASIAAKRQDSLSKNVVVPLGVTLLNTVKLLAKRARLSDKEVIEACVTIYYKTYIKALGKSKLPDESKND